MKSLMMKSGCAAVFALVAGMATAEVMDRPVGIKIGQRMTLKPYVSVSTSYDSNVDGRRHGSDDTVWLVNPGLGLEYKAENWNLFANVFYQYSAYAKNRCQQANSGHTYGEDLTFRWANSKAGERGWSLMLSEKFNRIDQTQNMSSGNGAGGYDRDRDEFKFAGAVQRRFTDKLHADLNVSYYWLDYDANNSAGTGYNGLFGWERWSVGGEIGYAFSPWTDLIIAASYQQYDSQNADVKANVHGISSDTQGWTVQGGIGSYATDRITYRLLGGWSTYRYDSVGDSSDGFSYTVTSNWLISDTWNTMLLATSYYQPTERNYGSSQRVDELSWGISHLMVRGKLKGTFDLCYRRETHEYTANGASSYDLDIMTFRLGLFYTINRYVSIFGTGEFRDSMPSGGKDNDRGDYYDYDRFRATLGLKFTY